jgi:hypothetical protein
MILEGVMIIVATSCLTFLHPGVSFQGAWSHANFSMRGRKANDSAKPMVMETFYHPGSSGS